MKSLLTLIGIFLLGYLSGRHSGWVNAHITVAQECEKLGAFFVGSRVYICSEWRDTDNTKPPEGINQTTSTRTQP